MTQAMISTRENTIFQVTSFIFLGAAAVVGFMQTTSTLLRSVMIALPLIIAALQARGPDERNPADLDRRSEMSMASSAMARTARGCT
jgi:hypothetical protein